MRHKRLGILFIAATLCLDAGLAAGQPQAARTDTVIDQGWEFRQLAPVGEQHRWAVATGSSAGRRASGLTAEQTHSRSFLS